MDIKEIEKNVKVEDNHILLGEPLKISKYKKTIEISQINWFYKWENFVYWLSIFLNNYYIICKNTKLPDKLNDIEIFRDNIRTTAKINKYAFKALMKICSYAKINTWNTLQWMKKKFSIDDWVEIFIYLYLYNIKGVKKNLLEGLYLLGKAQ